MLLQAIETGQRALAIASAIDDLSLQIQANHFLGSAYYRRGEYDRAIEHFRGNVESLVGDQIYERFGLVFLASVGSRYQLVLLFSDRGEFTEASIHANEVVRIAEVVNHPYNLYTAYFAVGCMHLRKGAIDKAIAALERSLELCRSWEFNRIFLVWRRLSGMRTLQLDGLVRLCLFWTSRKTELGSLFCADS